jgi:hypothetical protein
MIVDFSLQPQLNTDMGSSSIKVKRFHISRHNQLEFYCQFILNALTPGISDSYDIAKILLKE